MKLKHAKKYFILWLLMTGTSGIFCSKKPPLDRDVLARVGDKIISKHDFIISYELTPYPYLKQKDPGLSKKEAHLEWMIQKKLFVIDAVRKGFDRDLRVQKLLEWYRKKAAIRQLYREVVQKKVEITDREMRQAFIKLNEKVHARHIFTKDEKEAWEIYHKLISGATTFDEMARQKFKDPKLAKNGGDLGEFTWGDMDPDFEEAVFQLKPGQISQPVRTKWGYHIIKLESRTRNPILTEASYQSRKSYIRKIIKRRKEARIASQFINQFMTPKNVLLKGPAFALVANHLINRKSRDGALPVYLPKPLDPELKKTHRDLQDHLNDPLVTFDGGQWTVGDFLQKLKDMPLEDRPYIRNLNTLKNGIGIMVRDEFLAQEAFKRGLQNTPKALLEFERKKEDVLYAKYLGELLKDIHVTEDEVRNYYEKHKKKYVEPEKVNIREIFVRTKEEAKRIKKLILSGKDMAELAKKYSLRKWAVKHGGEFGYFSRKQYGEIGKQAFSHKIGEICGPVEVAGGPPGGGYSIFKIIDRKSKRQLTFEEVKDQIKKELLEQKKSRTIKIAVQNLKQVIPVVADKSKLDDIRVTTDWAEQPISLFAFTR